MFSHYAGNNYEAVKTQRVNVNINAASATAQSRYYFPDIPELNKVKIVAIACHIRPGEELDGDLNGTAINGYPYWGSFADPTPLYSMLNMVNENGEKVVENFPCFALFNSADTSTKVTPPNGSFTYGQYTGKVFPITGRFLIRECYLYVPNSASAPNNNVTASFTFYHL